MIVIRWLCDVAERAPMRRYPEAVTFDFHNTLAHCDQWFQLEIRELVPAFLSWYAAHNGNSPLGISSDDSVAVYRRLRTEIMAHGMEMDAVTCVDAVTRELGCPLPEETIEIGVETVMRTTLEDATAVPGVVDSVRQLRSEGIRLGVVSSAAYHPFLEWSLEKFGILDEFDSIVTSASCGYYKSRTEIYSIALEQLGSSSDRAVHVGDSHRFDVETASRLGIKTVWYNPDNVSIPDARPDATVTTLDGVDRLILDLFGPRDQ
jgi:HAD superfamily hydrolase (TIGR01509 family)